MSKSTVPKPVVAFFCLQKTLPGIFLLTLFILSTFTVKSSWQDRQDQKFTIKMENTTLVKVFKEVERQSTFRFFYSAKTMEKARPVSIHVRAADVAAVLAVTFKDQPFTYEIDKTSILVRPKSDTQSKTNPNTTQSQDTLIDVSGRVVSAKDGTPLPGATVKAEGSATGATTDANGYFKILMPSYHRLNISYIGFHQKIVGLPRDLDGSLFLISLEEQETALSGVEVVSTGYQVLPKERATGSFVSIDSSLVNRQIGTDIISRLEGVTNGMAFDRRSGKNTFSIRGISTLTSTISSPLIIVDNFPYNGALENINPNDVQSISVLKDAAAASIWGARSGNGVIVITTKKGKFNHTPVVSFNSNITFSEKPDLNYFRQMNTSDFIDVETYLFEKGYLFADTGRLTRPIFSPVYEILFQKRSQRLNSDEAQQLIDALRNKDIRRDFEKYIYRNAISQQNALQFSGGGTDAKYFVSAGYDKNLSRLIENDYERISLRSENTFRLFNRLEMQVGLNYTHGKTNNNSIGDYNSVSLGGGKASSLYPYAQFAGEDGQPVTIAKNYRSIFTDTAGKGKLLDWKYYPLRDMKETDQSSTVQDLVMNIGARYRLYQNLNIEVKYQYENQGTLYRQQYNSNTFFARDLINRYTQIHDNTLQYAIPSGGILDLDNRRLRSHNLRGSLSYNKTFKIVHEVSAIAGAELTDLSTNANTSRTYGYDEENGSSRNVDFVNRYPTYANVGGNAAIPNKLGFGKMSNRYRSYFLNASYTFLGRYILSASARKDESNLFGVETNKRGVPLWSTGIGWNVARETFFTSSGFSLLKLRATYGYQGNVNPSASSLPTILYQVPSSITNLLYASANTASNPNLRWEKVSMVNLGIDFALKNNYLSGSLEYYVRNSRDLLSAVPVDPASGFTTVTMNAADLLGKGIDLQLSSNNLNNSSLTWRTVLLLSYNKTIVKQYYNSSIRGNSFVGLGTLLNPVEGKVVYPLFSYRWAGLDGATGDPQGYLKGAVSKDYTAILRDSIQNQLFHGSAVPLYFGSLRNEIGFGNFQLSFNLLYKFKFFFRRPTISYNSLYSNWVGHSDYEKRWQKPGDEKITSVPSMNFPAITNRDNFYANSEATVERGDHIRLQDIRLSYDFKTPPGKAAFRSLGVYAYANNIGIIWRATKSGIDPDYTTNIIPYLRTYAVGIRGSF